MSTTAGDVLAQLASLILTLPVDHVLLLGTAAGGPADFRLTTKTRQQSGAAPGAIARTKENFAYREALSLLLIDNDGGRLTQSVLTQLSSQFNDVAMLTIPSSSSAVMLDGVPAKDGGEHTWIVARGGRQKEILKRLLELAALKGLAFIKIAANGRMLLRGPVDAAVWGAERLVFPGVNHVEPPVTQGPREPQLTEGEVLDVDFLLAGTDGLVDAEAIKRVVDAMKAESQPEANRVADEWGRSRVKEAIAKGGDRQRAPSARSNASSRGSSAPIAPGRNGSGASTRCWKPTSS